MALAPTERPAQVAASPKSSGGKSSLELWLGFIQALLVSGVVALIGTGVTAALKQRELDLANVKEMRALLLDLLTQQSLDGARASAVGLAAYGVYSIGPFVDLIQNGGDSQKLAAEVGLRSLAWSHPKETAGAMEMIVNNRTGFYTWRAHSFAVRLLGEMEWRRARRGLEAYDLALGASAPDSLALTRWMSMVREDQPPSMLNLVELKKNLRAALTAVGDEGISRNTP